MNEFSRVGDTGIFKDLIFIEGYENSSNVYILESKDGISLIDIGNDYTLFFEIDEIYGIENIENVFITHSHNDHSLGLLELLRSYGKFDNVRVFTHYTTKSGLEARISVFEKQNIKVVGLSGNEEIKLGNYKFKVLHTPGHTIDSISLYNAEFNILFSGDAIASNPIVDNKLGGNLRSYIFTLRNLRELNLDAIFPGHGYFAIGGCSEILTYCYKKAILALAPDKPINDVAIAAIKLGLIPEAEFVLEEYMKNGDEIDANAIKTLASIKADKGEYDNVRALLDDLINSNDFDAIYIAGLSAMKAGKFDDAAELFKKALEIKNDKKLKILLGASLFEANKKKEALQIEEFRELYLRI